MDELLRLEACTVDLQRRQLQRLDGGRETLTEQEYGLLCYLTARPGQTIPRDELLEQVWGYSTRSVTRAIDVAVRRLRQKIEADPARPRHIVSVRGVGYRFEGILRVEPAESPRLAPPPSGLIGRTAELQRALGLLSDPAGRRLVTLTGAPGVGKSKLLRQIHQRAYGSVDISGWAPCYVPLDTTLPMEPTALAHAIGQALGRSPSEVTPPAQLAELLRRHGPLLLLLDDADRVIEPLAQAVPAWLQAAPELRILVSSRERLRLVEEGVVELGPLPLPEAVALLEERALAVRAGWGEGTVLEEIAQRLDCNPLAIELAAARAEVLSPRELLRGLDERFRLLGGVHRRTDRQATLYAAIDWSWSMLSGWEQSALCQCSVFCGSFSVAAAAAVVDVSGDPDAPWLLDQIQALVGRSLVERSSSPTQVRFRLPESIRDFARAKAHERGGLQATEARHRDYYAELGASLLAQIHGPDGAQILRLLHLDADNLRAAFEHALGSSAEAAGQLMLALDTVFALRGPLDLRQRLLDRTLACDLPEEMRARALLCRARVAALQGDRALALEHSDAALALAERGAGPATLRHAWLTAGELRAQAGELHAALAHAERCARHAAEAGEAWLEARAVRLLALVHGDLGQVSELGQNAERLLLLASRTGDPLLRATALHLSARHAIARGRYALALPQLTEARKQAQELGDRHRELPLVMDLSRVALLAGDLPGGLQRLREGEEIAQELGHHMQVLRAEANIGIVLVLLERGEEAIEPLERSLAGTQARTGEGSRFIGLALAHWQCGRLALAQELLQEAADVALRQQAERCVARAHAYAAMVGAERADPAVFERHAPLAEPLREHGPARGFVLAVQGYGCVLRGDREGALRVLQELEQLEGTGAVYSDRIELVIGAELTLLARRLRRFIG